VAAQHDFVTQQPTKHGTRSSHDLPKYTHPHKDNKEFPQTQ